QTISRSVDYTATLQAFEEIHLAPSTPGRIESVFVEVGSRVKEGDALVQMDRTQLHQAEVQLRTLETDFRRLDTLQKVGSIPQQQFDQLKSQYDIAKSNVEFLRENTLLRAPFSGVVSGKYFENGEMYSGSPIATVGKAAILSLVQINRLKIHVAISENYFPLIRTGMNASIKLDIYPDKEFTGRIFNIYPTIDPASRSFTAEVEVNNPEGLLRPGMFCRLTIDFDQTEALMIPVNAILKLQGSNDRFLFIEENGIAKRVGVLVGDRFNDKVEVISDELKPGQNLIITGQSRLVDGMSVEVVK
ncbi:MAG: efflux RND transporter periplasmic adaptor subunit, partial [Sphingobacteriia bacterium]|nr:efflux RND transporter periplasmic adaptor subunit [Sphingobacteriia bacterium]